MSKKTKSDPRAAGSDYNPDADIAAGANLPDPEHEIENAMKPAEDPKSETKPAPEGPAEAIPAGANLPDPEHAIEDAMRNDLPNGEDNSEWIPTTRN